MSWVSCLGELTCLGLTAFKNNIVSVNRTSSDDSYVLCFEVNKCQS